MKSAKAEINAMAVVKQAEAMAMQTKIAACGPAILNVMAAKSSSFCAMG